MAVQIHDGDKIKLNLKGRQSARECGYEMTDDKAYTVDSVDDENMPDYPILLSDDNGDLAAFAYDEVELVVEVE